MTVELKGIKLVPPASILSTQWLDPSMVIQWLKQDAVSAQREHSLLL